MFDLQGGEEGLHHLHGQLVQAKVAEAGKFSVVALAVQNLAVEKAHVFFERLGAQAVGLRRSRLRGLLEV